MDGWRIGRHARCRHQPQRDVDGLGIQVLYDDINGRRLPAGKAHAVRLDADPIGTTPFFRRVGNKARQDLCHTSCTLPKVEQVSRRHWRVRAPLRSCTVHVWQLSTMVSVEKDIGLDFEHAVRDLQVVRGRHPIRKDDVTVIQPTDRM